MDGNSAHLGAGTGGVSAQALPQCPAVQVEHQRLVKDLMVKQATSDWILRAKPAGKGATAGGWAGWSRTRARCFSR